MTDQQIGSRIPRGFTGAPVIRGVAALLMFLVVAAQTAWAAENITSLVQENRGTVSLTIHNGCPACARYSSPGFRRHAQHLIPWSSDSMNRRVKKKLYSSLRLATRHVIEIHECHNLFSQLGADGIVKLAEALYYPASQYREHQICTRAVAFLWMSGSQTWLCQGFSKLTDEQAAITLIHEALHHSGLGEGRWDQTSADISRMVERACQL